MNVFSEDCLKGGTYLVTGASSGIGRTTALLIAASGGKVIVCGRDENRLNDTFKNLSDSNSHAMEIQDLIDVDQTAEWLKKIIKEYGPLNGVFHSAGMDWCCAARLVKQSDIEKLFSSSLYAAFGIAKVMSQKNAMVDGSSIVLMSSVAGSRGTPGRTVYSAAKAGIDGLIRSLACELAPRSIRVNSIVAALVNTPIFKNWANGAGPITVDSFEEKHLLGFGEPEDIAQAALFLLCAASRWITGTSLTVDGGYMVR